MQSISLNTSAGAVEGQCDARFRPVLDVFVRNFEQHGEVGASLCISLEGRTVIDVWGGRKSVGGEAWSADTIGIVFSCTKGASALCAHIAADRGLLDFNAPVTGLWPEFGQNGKDEALVSMMLDHSVGLSGFATVLKPDAFYDYGYMVQVLETAAPLWKPGTRNGYHAVTSAWTVGEMVRRSTGVRMGQFLRNEVTGPAGVDFWMGLPEEHEARVAPMIPSTASGGRIARAVQAAREGPCALAMRTMGLLRANTREARAAEIGSATGVSNGRGLAGLYEPLANGGRTADGRRLVSAEALTRMGQVSVATHEDATLMIPTRFALGFMKSMDNRALPDTESCSVVLPDAAFGHVGAGGSIGFADPASKMSFGYTMNRMGPGILMNERGQGLIDAACQIVGYTSDKSGVWV
jgi:CubicO group peptidase (beta-lactamase class C family)